MSNSGFLKLAAALCSVAFAPVALADRECVAGFRATTGGERATMTKVLAGVKSALPAPPEGWIVDGDDSVEVLNDLCRDEESAPWKYHFTRSYRRVDGLESRGQAYDKAKAELTASEAGKQPRLDALTARMEEIAKQLGEALTKGNEARAAVLQKQIATLSAEYEAVATEGGGQARFEAAGKQLSRDVAMQIRVSINPSYEEPDRDARGFTVPGGVQSAHRWVDSRSEVPQERAVLLLGTWKKRAGTPGFEVVPRAGVAPIRPQAVSIHIAADESRMDATIAGIDMQSLIAATLR